MKQTLSLTGLVLALACAPAEVAPPPAQPVAPPPPPAAATQEPAPAPPPTAEELKKAEEKQKLEQDFAKLEQDNTAELARLTPELRAQVTKLTDSGTGGIRSIIRAALKGPQRRPGHAERDAQRHPLETLEFLGIQPNHQVLEVGPGEGWFTELLAPALAKRGKLLVTLTDPNGSKDDRATYYGKRTQMTLDSLPEAYSKVERLMFDPKQPALTTPAESLDVVLLFRGAHGLVNSGSLESWLAEFNRVLKPKGILGIEQHRAAVGADAAVTSKQGYLPESFVIEQIEKAGFKLVSKSEINANKKDTKDYADGVWALPPTLRGGDVERAKFVAIGESDRMTLKFRKVASKAPSAPAAAATAAPATPAPVAAATPAPAAPVASAKPAPVAAATPAAPAPATPPAAAPKSASPAPAAPAGAK